jgi:hypothetical protein
MDHYVYKRKKLKIHKHGSIMLPTVGSPTAATVIIMPVLSIMIAAIAITKQYKLTAGISIFNKVTIPEKYTENVLQKRRDY